MYFVEKKQLIYENNFMKKSPLISIIIPVFNLEKYIGECLRSVISQTYKNLEIIVVDDGSTDASGVICDQFAKNDVRIKVIHKKNEGSSVARNVGMEIALGDYIGFVDGDDYIDLDMYEYLLSLIQENAADISVCRFRKIDLPYKPYNVESESNEIEVLDSISAVRAFIKYKKHITGYIWNGLYSRQVLVPFTVGVLFQDQEFKVKSLLKASRIVTSNTIKYNYRYRAASVTNYGHYEKKVHDFSIIATNIQNCLSILEDKSLLNLYYRRALKFGVSFLSGSLHSDMSGISDIRFFIKKYVPLVYGQKSVRSFIICNLLRINLIWPYKLVIGLSDFILDKKKRLANAFLNVR